ncbi:MAG: FlhC family transcriptional regulator [Methylovulum sp.]|nr:FlhC family transcriptional regulator [Methylovulum sp.]
MMKTQKEKILDLQLKLTLAHRLIKEGARPSIVRAVCHISKHTAINLYKEIHGYGPVAGLLPYDPYWATKSPHNCLHASIFFNIYNILSKSSESKGQIFLTSFLLYKETLNGGKVKMDVNRAWYVGQQMTLSYLSGVKCEKCYSTFVAIESYPTLYKFCPICDTITDSTERKKWKKPITFKKIL